MGAGLRSTAAGQWAHFTATRWQQLAAVARDDPAAEPAARAALADLYQSYSLPVYASVRRRGYGRQDAQDLTQDFFVHLLEKNTLRRVDQQKGKFRTFLLGALDRFLHDAAGRGTTRKRGGQFQMVSLDATTFEAAEPLAAVETLTPDRAFELGWAKILVSSTLERLRAEMTSEGRGDLLEALRGYILGADEAAYQQTADRLGLSLGALKTTIFRLRARYRALLRESVAGTLNDPTRVEAELQELGAALRAH